jgi:hypothetical protein
MTTSGLSAAEALDRLSRFGPNVVPVKARSRLPARVVNQSPVIKIGVIPAFLIVAMVSEADAFSGSEGDQADQTQVALSLGGGSGRIRTLTRQDRQDPQAVRGVRVCLAATVYLPPLAGLLGSNRLPVEDFGLTVGVSVAGGPWDPPRPTAAPSVMTQSSYLHDFCAAATPLSQVDSRTTRFIADPLPLGRKLHRWRPFPV